MQLALQAGEESGDAVPVVKSTKKKKKKAGGKKKMSKEEAIAAAQEAQAAAAAALEKGISHEDAAKAAEAALKVRALLPCLSLFKLGFLYDRSRVPTFSFPRQLKCKSDLVV